MYATLHTSTYSNAYAVQNYVWQYKCKRCQIYRFMLAEVQMFKMNTYSFSLIKSVVTVFSCLHKITSTTLMWQVSIKSQYWNIHLNLKMCVFKHLWSICSRELGSIKLTKFKDSQYDLFMRMGLSALCPNPQPVEPGYLSLAACLKPVQPGWP
jgi:hypothetical protein